MYTLKIDLSCRIITLEAINVTEIKKLIHKVSIDFKDIEKDIVSISCHSDDKSVFFVHIGCIGNDKEGYRIKDSLLSDMANRSADYF